MVMYIAIEGADGSGKSAVATTTYQRLLERSNQRDHIELVSHNAFEQSSSHLARTIGSRTNRVTLYGEQKGLRVVTGLGYFLSLFPYLFAKRKGKRKGIIVSDRSPWVTGPIYVSKVFGTVAKVVNPILKPFLEIPDYIIHLQVDSEVAQERLGEKGYGQLYHSREDLDELVAGYDVFMKNLGSNPDVGVFSIDTNNKTIDEVCEEATAFIDEEIRSKEQLFIQEMKSISDKIQTVEYANLFERVRDVFGVESLKGRLAQWYEEGKIDEFDGAEVIESLNKSTVQYILANSALFVGLGVLTPTGIGSFISCPARFFWTIGNRIYWTAKHDKERAKIHGLDIAIMSAIPMVGSGAHLLSLWRENPKLFSLVKEHSAEYILGSKFKRHKK